MEIMEEHTLCLLVDVSDDVSDAVCKHDFNQQHSLRALSTQPSITKLPELRSPHSCISNEQQSSSAWAGTPSASGHGSLDVRTEPDYLDLSPSLGRYENHITYCIEIPSMLTDDRYASEFAADGERRRVREGELRSRSMSPGSVTSFETDSPPGTTISEEIHFEYRDMEARWGGWMLNGGTGCGPQSGAEGCARFTYERCRATQGGFQVNGFVDSVSFARMGRWCCSTSSGGCSDGGSATKDHAATSVLSDSLHCQEKGVMKVSTTP